MKFKFCFIFFIQNFDKLLTADNFFILEEKLLPKITKVGVESFVFLKMLTININMCSNSINIFFFYLHNFCKYKLLTRMHNNIKIYLNSENPFKIDLQTFKYWGVHIARS